MTMSAELTELLRSDVDDIQARVSEYDSRTRFRIIRNAAEEYESLDGPVERVKAMWVVQAALACIEDRQLPYATSSELAPRLASIIESKREARESRRSALDALALVFRKTRQLTESLDAMIRLAFLSALKSRDPQMSGFASEALSGEGILAQRSPGRRPPLRVAMKKLRARLAKSTRLSRREVVRPARPKAEPRKSARRSDVRHSSHKNVQ